MQSSLAIESWRGGGGGRRGQLLPYDHFLYTTKTSRPSSRSGVEQEGGPKNYSGGIDRRAFWSGSRSRRRRGTDDKSDRSARVRSERAPHAPGSAWAGRLRLTTHATDVLHHRAVVPNSLRVSHHGTAFVSASLCVVHPYRPAHEPSARGLLHRAARRDHL